MRLIKVNAPQGKGADVAQIAFSVGIEKVSVFRIESLRSNASVEVKDSIDIETSTPQAKRFVDALVASDFYDQKDYTINIRQPRAIISCESIREMTKPLVEPPTDIVQELWQFSHITYGFVGRIFIAAGLLAYGMIEQKLLLIIAGLLFLPLLPLLLAVSFGIWTKNLKLAGQGALAFFAAAILLVLGGAAVAAVSDPPLKYDDFNTLPVGILISVAVGIAAGLANIDDVGRRELIGLAATAQIALIPVWLGICAVLGFPTGADQNEITTRAASFFLNAATIILFTLIVYVISKMKRHSFEKSV